jgi:hypothetical protein
LLKQVLIELAEVAMPSSYFTMWGMLILMALGAVGELVSQGNVLGSIGDAFPSELAKRDALHRCGDMDTEFSRFSAQDRENCYRVILNKSDHGSSTEAAAW